VIGRCEEEHKVTIAIWRQLAKDKTAGAKEDVFFELNQTLRPQPFDRSKLARVNVEGRARVLLEYMPLIRSEPKKLP